MMQVVLTLPLVHSLTVHLTIILWSLVLIILAPNIPLALLPASQLLVSNATSCISVVDAYGYRVDTLHYIYYE